MTRVLITNTVPGAPNIAVGSIVELAESEAHAWIRCGVASEVPADLPEPIIATGTIDGVDVPE